MANKKTIIGRFIELKEQANDAEKALFRELLDIDRKKSKGSASGAEKPRKSKVIPLPPSTGQANA